MDIVPLKIMTTKLPVLRTKITCYAVTLIHAAAVNEDCLTSNFLVRYQNAGHVYPSQRTERRRLIT